VRRVFIKKQILQFKTDRDRHSTLTSYSIRDHQYIWTPLERPVEASTHRGQEKSFNEMHVLQARIYCEDDDRRSKPGEKQDFLQSRCTAPHLRPALWLCKSQKHPGYGIFTRWEPASICFLTSLALAFAPHVQAWNNWMLWLPHITAPPSAYSCTYDQRHTYMARKATSVIIVDSHVHEGTAASHPSLSQLLWWPLPSFRFKCAPWSPPKPYTYRLAWL